MTLASLWEIQEFGCLSRHYSDQSARASDNQERSKALHRSECAKNQAAERVHAGRVGGATFGTYVQVDDDEAFLLDGLDTSLGLGGLRCDATACNPAVYAPGPLLDRQQLVG